MSRWLITGAGGMLGRDLVAVLGQHGAQVTGLTRRDLDVTDERAVAATVDRLRPDVVVNCAAWTAVDDAETQEQAALRVNGHAAAYLAAACGAAAARMVQLSTDYVFSGDARSPYAEDDVPAPRSAYGRTKLAGERAVRTRLPATGYVVRTAWLYGQHGQSFVRTMIKLARERPAVDVVTDQYGQPTWTADVAGRIVALVSRDAPAGIYHATSSGETTWFGLAQEVFRLLGTDPARVKATASRVFVRPAPRPAYSVLGHDAWARAGIEPIADWRVALRAAFPELTQAPGAGGGSAGNGSSAGGAATSAG